ncbi:MAG: nitroreductase family protein [Clostridiales bacterium]|nr:nitroreductase family protein [Clostridiales bacterium]
MNEVLKVISTRFSCRNFTDEPVAQEHLEAIAKAAVESPSAMNLQPWRIVAVTDRELLDEIDSAIMEGLKETDQNRYDRMVARGGKIFFGGTAVFFIPTKIDESNPYTNIDLGIVSQTIALAATSLGLGSLICGYSRHGFKGEKGKYFAKRLGFPPGYRLDLAVVVGHKGAEGSPHEPDMSKISYIA